MCSATVAPLRAAEPREPRHTSPAPIFAASFTHPLGRAQVVPGHQAPVAFNIGRLMVSLTADEADQVAMALAKAAADSRRVIR